jgi:5-methylcytosine-specific restriction endonuclease McrA
MLRTLLLTPAFSAHSVVSWEASITLLYLGKIDVLASYDEVVRSPSVSLQVPAVARLLQWLAPPRRRVRFNRRNVYLRDGSACAYCGARPPLRELTLDHVTPRCRGGTSTWENVLTACKPCNAHKANRSLAELGLVPRRMPYRPRSLPRVPLGIDRDAAPPEWRPFVATLR